MDRMSLKSSKLGGSKAALRKRFYARIIAPVVPAMIGQAEGLPDADPEAIAAVAADFICSGPMEVFLAMLGGFMTLNILCLFTRGKQLKSLPLESQKEFFIKAFDSKIWALRGLSVLSGLPVKVAYYNQQIVCDALGYKRTELVEDALKHQVSRDSQPA